MEYKKERASETLWGGWGGMKVMDFGVKEREKGMIDMS